MKAVRIIKNERGFSLIELLIVMVILGLLAGLVGPKLFGKVDSSKQKTAKTQISLFESALDTYRLDNGRFPTSEQGLKALREKPEGAARWKGPYLPKEIPVDPWGNAYVYRSPSEHGDFDIVSNGADNAPGGEGNDMDIVSWKDLD
ncbi:type II secretion system major pseudopilin GspG [Desulforegula conservatrix]|uniref:type II secretion system major pseudopilin GspG n=1 Tax=Desulforegula conservatrix TaxID=153026 RepID=UPI00040F0717|nr:type II secretion system major pseudopilin GspG [Desulforegula conservatrix]